MGLFHVGLSAGDGGVHKNTQKWDGDSKNDSNRCISNFDFADGIAVRMDPIPFRSGKEMQGVGARPSKRDQRVWKPRIRSP